MASFEENIQSTGQGQLTQRPQTTESDFSGVTQPLVDGLSHPVSSDQTMSSEKKMKLTYFTNFFDTHPTVMTLKDITDIACHDEQLRKFSEQYRQQKALANDDSLSGSAKAAVLRLVKKYKQYHCVVIPSALCEGGKTRESIAVLLALIGIDIDDITADELRLFLQKMAACPHTAFASKSPSYEGGRAFILIDNIDAINDLWQKASKNARSALFKFVWQQVADYVEQLTGLKVDDKCANPEHAYSIAYDPDAYFNPSAIPFHIDLSGYKPPKAGRPKAKTEGGTGKDRKVYHADLETVELRIENHLKTKDHHIEDGRNTYLYHFAQECNKYGVDQSEVEEWAANTLLANDFDGAEIQRTIDSAYSQTENFGTKRAEFNAIEFIIKKLTVLAQYRFNTVIGRLELKYSDGIIEDGPLDWHPITDRDFSTLYTRVSSDHRVSQNDVNAVLSSIDFSDDFHPMKDYLTRCSAWDPSQPDYIADLFDHLKLADESHRDRYFYYFKMWFLRFVALATDVTDKNQLVPALIGKENTGKTFFWEQLLPPSLRSYYQRVDPNDQLDKDMIITMASKFLCNFDERRISKRNSDTFKSVISGGLKSVRRPYGRFNEDIQQKASLVMTSNDIRYISDPAGDRRYLSIEILGTVNFYEHPINHEGLYAQAWYLINHGELRNSLTAAETQELKELNTQYTEIDECEDAITTFFRVPTPEDRVVKRLSITQMKLRIGNVYGFEALTATRIGTTLHNLGFTKKKINGCYVYLVVEQQIAQSEPHESPVGQRPYSWADNDDDDDDDI